jgi:hypothetical protein
MSKIITFYSYKGGTGRSMALANVAWILATNGRRVLVVDWDLEAPGLHHYFRPFLVDRALKSTPGIFDLVFDYTLAALTPGDEEAGLDWYSPMPISSATPFPWSGISRPVEGSTLFRLPNRTVLTPQSWAPSTGKAFTK